MGGRQRTSLFMSTEESASRQARERAEKKVKAKKKKRK